MAVVILLVASNIYAHLREHGPRSENPGVGGSIPSQPTIVSLPDFSDLDRTSTFLQHRLVHDRVAAVDALCLVADHRGARRGLRGALEPLAADPQGSVVRAGHRENRRKKTEK